MCRSKIKITVEDYEDMAENCVGYCSKCKSFTSEGLEIDEDEGECEECGCNSVMGIQNALLLGMFNIVG